jgi:hypothetical protein
MVEDADVNPFFRNITRLGNITFEVPLLGYSRRSIHNLLHSARIVPKRIALHSIGAIRHSCMSIQSTNRVIIGVRFLKDCTIYLRGPEGGEKSPCSISVTTGSFLPP